MFSVPAATTTAPASTRSRCAPASTYSTPLRLAVLDQHALDARRPRAARACPPPRRRGCRCSCVDLPAFVGQPCRHEPQLMQFASVYDAHRLERRAELAEGGLDGADALPPVASTRARRGAARRGRNAAPGRGAQNGCCRSPSPLASSFEVLLVRAQRDLRVDRRRPADAATGEQRDRAGPRRRRSARSRIGHQQIVRRLRLPAREVGRGPVRPSLEQEHVAAALRRARPRSRRRRAPEPTTTTSKRSLMRSPCTTSPCASRRRERRVEVDLLPRARSRPLPGATKSL